MMGQNFEQAQRENTRLIAKVNQSNFTREYRILMSSLASAIVAQSELRTLVASAV